MRERLKQPDLFLAEALIKDRSHLCRYGFVILPQGVGPLRQEQQGLPLVFCVALTTEKPLLLHALQHSGQGSNGQTALVRQGLDGNAVSLPQHMQDAALRAVENINLLFADSDKRYSLHSESKEA